MEKWDDKLFKKWLNLRDQVKKYKKEQNWDKVISLCEEILELDIEASFIGIMVPLFYKEIAHAYEKKSDFVRAINYYLSSKKGLEEYRNNNKLNSPNDWLADIKTIENKITKLEIKSSK